MRVRMETLAMMQTIFSITSDRGLGGISSSLLTYSRAMALTGIRHVIAVPSITPVFAELNAMANVEIISLSSFKLRFHSLTQYWFSPRLRKVMEEADAVFIHNAKHAHMPPRYRGKTYVINHNGKTNRLDFAPNIIFLNTTAKQHFLERFPTLTTHNIVMGHGFNVFPEIKRKPRQETPVQIISAGRVMEKKGYRELVETARLLQDANVNCHISVFGEGPDEGLLRDRIAEYQLNNITLHGWTNDLRSEMAKADIFCTPSHGESFPLVIGEALEAGLAIASTRTNGASEYFSYASADKPIGLLADIHDVRGMAAILAKMVKNHELRRSMNKNARALLLDNFSLQNLADKFSRLCSETRARPRIYMATQTFPPRVGGMENVMKALAEKLSYSGFDITVFPNRSYRVVSSFRVVNLRLIKPLRIIGKRLILRLLLRNEDVIICDSWKSVNVITRKFKGRLVIMAHGQEFMKGTRRRASIQAALDRSYRVVASSQFTAALIHEEFEIDPEKVSTIPPTYMVEKAEIEEKKDVSKTLRLISVCRLDPRKGLLEAIQALSAPDLRNQDWEWDIIGDGVQLADLKKAAKALGMSDKITFRHKLDDKTRDNILRKSDLFVMPSYQKGRSIEGFGVSYIEAACAGLPAIAGNTGGAREAVLDGKTGWCVDATDTETIHRAFSEALTSRQEVLRRGQLAQQHFLSAFESEVVFARFLNETGLSDTYQQQE